MNLTPRITIAAIVTTLAGASAQCPRAWAPGDGIQGLNSPALAMTTWDPDGPGPLPEFLVAGGNFSLAGSTPVRGLAVWNGSEWSDLSGFAPGIGGFDGSVDSLAVFHGDLYAAGSFTHADGSPANGIARWNGNKWESLGAGVNGDIHAILVFNDRLIVGGYLFQAGDVLVPNVAAWNGSSWESVGEPGISNGPVLALAAFNGELIAGGRFTRLGTQPIAHLAAWNGTTWREHFGGTDGEVDSLAVQQGKVVIAGRFAHAGDQEVQSPARWNGTAWETLVDPGFLPAPGSSSLWLQGDDLYAQTYRGLSRYDGAQWHAVDENSQFQPECVATYHNMMVASGLFLGTYSGTDTAPDPVVCIGAWDGTRWNALGAGWDGKVLSIIEHDGELFAGGRFGTAGGVPARNVAVLRDGRWTALGDGPGAPVSSLRFFRGELLAGTSNGPHVSLGSLARWDGYAWTALASAGEHAAPLSAVSDMLEWHDDLFVATPEWSSDYRGLARWDGAKWHSFDDMIDGYATCLCEYQGSVLACGYLQSVTHGAGPVFRWDGFSWTPVGDNISTPVTQLVVHEGYLFARGTRWMTVDGEWDVSIARFDGSKWIPVWRRDWEFDIEGPLVSLPDGLYAYGSRRTNDGIYHSILRFDGERWTAVTQAFREGDGIRASISSFLKQGDDLLVAGSLASTGATVAANILRLSCTCPADANRDSFVNGEDADLFLGWFDAGEDRADINADGFVNGADFDEFVAAFEAGC